MSHSSQTGRHLRSSIARVGFVLITALLPALPVPVAPATTEPAVIVRDINRGVLGSDPHSLMNVNGTLFFTAQSTSYNSTNGLELWKSDGTEAGTTMVQNLWPGATSSLPSEFTLVGDSVFFAAFDPLMGEEVWVMPLSAFGLELNQGYLPLIVR